MRDDDLMDSVSLMFNRNEALLGEVSARSGICCNFMLTNSGEREIGAHMVEWQTRGVPVVRSVGKGYFQERVLFRDPHFLHALSEWASHHHVAIVTLSPEALECWELLARLPLEPKERFAMIVTLRGAEPKKIAEWRTALGKAAQAVASEERIASKAIQQLWEQAARDLAAKFNKTARSHARVA